MEQKAGAGALGEEEEERFQTSIELEGYKRKKRLNVIALATSNVSCLAFISRKIICHFQLQFRVGLKKDEQSGIDDR